MIKSSASSVANDSVTESGKSFPPNSYVNIEIF